MSCSWLLLAVLLAVAACEGVEASALRKDGGLDSALGGCAELGLCCQGKNNTCRVRRHRNSISDDDGDDDDEQNSVLVKARRNICYCDSACLDLADCCRDYEQACARKFTADICRKCFEEPTWIYNVSVLSACANAPFYVVNLSATCNRLLSGSLHLTK